MKRKVLIALSVCLLIPIVLIMSACVEATVPDGYYMFDSLKINGETITEGSLYEFYSGTGYVIGATRFMEVGYSLDQKFKLEGDKIMLNIVNQTWQFSDLYYRDEKIIRFFDENTEITYSRLP